jgi:hypothetical protein
LRNHFQFFFFSDRTVSVYPLGIAAGRKAGAGQEFAEPAFFFPHFLAAFFALYRKFVHIFYFFNL